MKLAVIVPVLNEEAGIVAALERLRHDLNPNDEIIVVDGGSIDRTIERASLVADRLVHTEGGRGPALNAGARASNGQVLLFLHSDTRLPQGWRAAIVSALEPGGPWGRFDIRIEGRSRLLLLVGFMMNMRSRLTGIATGDQAIFMTREAFDRVGGFPEIPLMEDITMSARLKKIARPACLSLKAVTSGRRWEKKGVLRTILLMWSLRLRYYFGADPAALNTRYRR